MTRESIEFSCPCCGKRIEVEPRSRRARAVDPRDRAGKDFDGLLAAQSRESERLDDLFDGARSEHASESERIDKLFGDAKRTAREDDAKPRSPFDLD